jgi:hypothetical protein
LPLHPTCIKSEEQNEGVQMEVNFNVALISHPTKFEGTSWVVENFCVIVASRLTNVSVYAKTIIPPIDSNVVVFFDAVVNMDSKVPMV